MQTVLFVNERGEVLITCDEAFATAPDRVNWDPDGNRLSLRLMSGDELEIGSDLAPDMISAIESAETALLVEMQNDQPKSGIDLRIVKNPR